jgi:Ran GTPase-activating protein (RanGAP) involved in mRNA processing and transport
MDRPYTEKVMTVTEADVKKYLRKLYRFLRQGHTIKFKKLKGHRGFIYLGEVTVLVELDHRDHVISTFVHEFLHYVHPEWEEDRILNLENALMKKLTARQVCNIFKRLAEAM